MKKKIIFNSVINPLSIGQTGYNMLRALFDRSDIDVKFHPLLGSQVDLSNFPRDDAFAAKLQASLDTRFDISFDTPAIKLWHISGAENKITNNQHLFTFHETDAVTDIEKSIMNLQNSVFTSSSESIRNFARAGVTAKLASIPLGLDPDIKRNSKDYKMGGVTHWGLMGKIEKRKNTAQIIKSWIKLYGNNPKHQLSCAIVNQFMKQEQFQQIIGQIFEGKTYSNVNFLPYLKNDAVIDYLNAIDIELSGLSNGEGWNIPAFNACALGKWVPTTNITAHRDWANAENSLLIEPDGMQPCYDGQFFHQGSPFNQGNIYYFSPETIEKAMVDIAERAKWINHKGIEMGNRLTYANTVDLILKEVFKDA